MGCDHALSTELGATVAAPIAGSPLEYAFDHPRQRLAPMRRPCAAPADRPGAWAVPFLAARGRLRRSAARYAGTAAPNKIQFSGCRRIANLHQLHAHRRSTVTLIAWKQRIGETGRCTLKEKYPCW